MSAATTPSAEPWTTRRLLAWMQESFKAKGIESPRLCAEILLSHVTGQKRLALYTDQDRIAEPSELAALRTLVARALKHEPIQYLVGEAWFFALPMAVDRRVLIPRPCTETIVEETLQFARRRTPPAPMNNDERAGALTPETASADHDDATLLKAAAAEHRKALAAARAARQAQGEGLLIADVCTGSGCIAVALAKNLPAARFVATDLSLDALEVARDNAAKHGVIDRIDLRQGHLLEPLAEYAQEKDDGSSVPGFDVIAANPPYIPDDEWDAVAPNVREHEPTQALRGGTDGLDLVGPILRDAPALLKPGGLLIIELAAATADVVHDAATRHSLLEVARVINDLEGHKRFVAAVRRSTGA